LQKAWAILFSYGILGESMLVPKNKHKIPLAYSRADESARSLNNHRDDELSAGGLL
jgi:hypothetical protein